MWHKIEEDDPLFVEDWEIDNIYKQQEEEREKELYLAYERELLEMKLGKLGLELTEEDILELEKEYA